MENQTKSPYIPGLKPGVLRRVINKHATSKQSHNRKLNQKFVKEHKTFVREWDAVLFDYLKSNEKPSYSEFREMLADKAPDFEGSSRSLFYYLQKH